MESNLLHTFKMNPNAVIMSRAKQIQSPKHCFNFTVCKNIFFYCISTDRYIYIFNCHCF